MAQGMPKAAQYKGENVNFPILFNDGGLQVFKNLLNELFVEDMKSGVTIWIKPSSFKDGGLEFTTKHLVEPILANGMIAWVVGPR